MNTSDRVSDIVSFVGSAVSLLGEYGILSTKKFDGRITVKTDNNTILVMDLPLTWDEIQSIKYHTRFEYVGGGIFKSQKL